MGIKEVERHPDYTEALSDWELMADAVKGEGAIKKKQKLYLPPTPGMIRNRTDDADLHPKAQSFSSWSERGETRYDAYLRRAEFPHKVKPACRTAAGLFTAKDAVFEIPDEWEPVRECMTSDAETVADFHLTVSTMLCETGRLGIWADVRSNGELPIWVAYDTFAISDWDTELIDDKNVLTYLQLETTDRIGTERVRILRRVYLREDGVHLEQFVKAKDDDEYTEMTVAQPRTARTDFGTATLPDDDGRPAGHRLPWIPFQFINADNLTPKVGQPPFLSLARKSVHAYQLSANYNEALTLSEPTYVVNGMTPEWIAAGHQPKSVGLGTLWLLPAGATADVLESTGPMIPEQRTAINEALDRCDELAMRPFETRTAVAESGEAKKERRKTQTSPALIMAKNVGAGMQRIFRLSAEWFSKDPEMVNFKPNNDFVEAAMDAQTMAALSALKDGGTISKRTFHDNLQKGGVTDFDYETEQELIGRGE